MDRSGGLGLRVAWEEPNTREPLIDGEVRDPRVTIPESVFPDSTAWTETVLEPKKESPVIPLANLIGSEAPEALYGAASAQDPSRFGQLQPADGPRPSAFDPLTGGVDFESGNDTGNDFDA